jgi:hypothetical protein
LKALLLLFRKLLCRLDLLVLLILLVAFVLGDLLVVV